MAYLVADLPTININPNLWTSGLASAVGPWIAGGLGLGVVILAVLLGWRKLRELCEADEELTAEEGLCADEQDACDDSDQDAEEESL